MGLGSEHRFSGRRGTFNERDKETVQKAIDDFVEARPDSTLGTMRAAAVHAAARELYGF